MPPIVEAMGLAWNGQLELIKNDSVLSPTMHVTCIVAEDEKKANHGLSATAIPGRLAVYEFPCRQEIAIGRIAGKRRVGHTCGSSFATRPVSSVLARISVSDCNRFRYGPVVITRGGTFPSAPL